VLTTIFGILKHVKEKGILKPEVALEDLKLGPAEKSKTAPFFTLEQSTQRHHITFSLGWRTGARAGELLALTIHDLDFEHKTIRISKVCDDNNREIRNETKALESNAVLEMSSALRYTLELYSASLESE
jgi:integrase